jgi:hypothetical protein
MGRPVSGCGLRIAGNELGLGLVREGSPVTKEGVLEGGPPRGGGPAEKEA